MSKRLAIAALLAIAAPGLAHAASRAEIDALVEKHATAQNVPSWVIHRIIKRESNYNPGARGGSALGLMQIKRPTARGVGYRGDASGLYDADTNLKYGTAYLAGAWRLSGGNYDVCYRHYQRGYYYAARRSRMAPVMAVDTKSALVVGTAAAQAPAASSSFGLASLFGLRSATPTPVAAPAEAASTHVAAAEVARRSRSRSASRKAERRIAVARKSAPKAAPVQVAAPDDAPATAAPATVAAAPATAVTTAQAAPAAPAAPAPVAAPAAPASLFASAPAATTALVKQATAAPAE